MTPLQQIIAELKTELSMRRKVWRKIHGSQDQFIEIEHQRRYNVMVMMLELMEAQTDRELNLLIDRVRRNKEAAAAQTSLF